VLLVEVAVEVVLEALEVLTVEPMQEAVGSSDY
jgi:hypothetical protein